MSRPSNPVETSLEVIRCPATVGGCSAGAGLRRGLSALRRSPRAAHGLPPGRLRRALSALRRSSSAANAFPAGRLRRAGRYCVGLAAAAAWRTFTVRSFLMGPVVVPAACAGTATPSASTAAPAPVTNERRSTNLGNFPSPVDTEQARAPLPRRHALVAETATTLRALAGRVNASVPAGAALVRW